MFNCTQYLETLNANFLRIRSVSLFLYLKGCK